MGKRKGVERISCRDFDMGDFYLCLSTQKLIESDNEKIKIIARYYLHYLTCSDCRNLFGEAYEEVSNDQN